MPGSPPRSSSFSETDETPAHDVIMGDDNGIVDGSNLIVAGEEEVVDEEAPLSLVVEKPSEVGAQLDLSHGNESGSSSGTDQVSVL
jgi:hypothetical protein